ncbi:MAG: transglycosylase SLT domain-containing protein [Bdellovibrionales bacterium]
MTPFEVVRTYFILNVLLAFGGIATSRVTFEKFSFAKLKLQYAVLGSAVFFSGLSLFARGSGFGEPLAKVWADGVEIHGQGPTARQAIVTNQVQKRTDRPQLSYLKSWDLLLGLGVISLLSFALVRLLIAYVSLCRKTVRAVELRRWGRVHMLLGEASHVPYSFWNPGGFFVVVPLEIWLDSSQRRVVVAHELQHHRQGDTMWIHLMMFLETFCWWNWFARKWFRQISILQEFACDEIVLRSERVSPQEYSRCLLQVAQSALRSPGLPAGAAGFGWRKERQILKRRIASMISKKEKPPTGLTALALSFLLVTVLMGGTAYGLRGMVQDRRLTLEQVRRMAGQVTQQKDFPIVVNEMVVEQLNHYIGSPEGRTYMRSALERLESQRRIVEEYIERYGVPSALAAVPIAESGYRNLPPSANPSTKAAGLWQFIPSTARKFGLRVDQVIDERLDIPLSTDAALRYLLSNKLQFNDWQLAVLAYNMGEGNVQKAIAATGSKDAWTLIRKGYEGDKNYLAKVVASILILANPDSLN